jgi:hypothetical protein
MVGCISSTTFCPACKEASNFLNEKIHDHQGRMFSKNYNTIQGINANPKALAQANDQTASLSLLFRLRFDFRFSFDVWRSSFDVVCRSPYQIRRSSSDIIAKAVRRVPHLVRDAAYKDE